VNPACFVANSHGAWAKFRDNWRLPVATFVEHFESGLCAWCWRNLPDHEGRVLSSFQRSEFRISEMVVHPKLGLFVSCLSALLSSVIPLCFFFPDGFE
jgi:hypothetical protein